MNRLIGYIFSLKSVNEDKARRERIFNILVLGIVLLVTYLLVATVINNWFTTERHGGSLEIVAIFTLSFWALFFFSKTVFYRFTPFSLIGLLFLASSYTLLKWGINVPQGLLLFALIIVISGILIGSKFAIIVLIICALILSSIGYGQINNFVIVDRHWASKSFEYVDIAAYTITLGVITLVSWLYNQEMEKALKRARTSEKALQKEKDLLEIKVEKRTRQIQKMQIDEIMQIYKFADFGKLAAGLFHDLVTPLNTVSLNLENLKEETKIGNHQDFKEIRQTLNRAVRGTKDIEKFVVATRQQLQHQQTKSYFNLNSEIGSVLVELSVKSLNLNVDLNFSNKNPIYTFGNSFRFHQLAINLISNAIEAYSNVKKSKDRVVNIRLFEQKNQIIFEVEDLAIGINSRKLRHIFEPFYSTKPAEQGMGIGLTICKDIVEKEFGGNILVQSKLNKGTIFIVQVPIINKNGLH